MNPVGLPKTAGFARRERGSLRGMKQAELARKLAREARVPAAAAQDRIDELVHRIIKNLRRGRPVELPGLGRLVVPGRPRKRQ